MRLRKGGILATQELTSFLKWAGGKRWLVGRFRHLFPQEFKSYYEPFLGSGSVFFSLRPSRGQISDSNPELINLYRSLKRAPRDLVRALRRHATNHSTNYYYEVRAARPRSEIEQAARTLYLNRTCWNGLYRVNRKGEFNVPRGTKDQVIFENDNFEAISSALWRIRIRCCDFEETIDAAKCDDFVFVDPPYTVSHNNNGFIKYNEAMFTWSDQLRLREAIKRACDRGAKILLTNADHGPIRDMYRTLGDLHILPRESIISGSANGRKKTSELAVQMNY